METRLDPPSIPLLVLAAAAPSGPKHHCCRGLQGRLCWSWGSRGGRQPPVMLLPVPLAASLLLPPRAPALCVFDYKWHGAIDCFRRRCDRLP